MSAIAQPKFVEIREGNHSGYDLVRVNEETLLHEVKSSLEPIAENNGYQVKSVSLSYPESSAVMAAVTYATASTVIAGVVVVAAGSVMGIPGMVGAISSGAAGGAAVGGGIIGVIIGMVDGFNHLNRHELHYTIKRSGDLLPISGSCLVFFSHEDNAIYYEIDTCTHVEVFPQDEIGSLRIGNNGVDIFDKMLFQTDVVETGVLPIE